LFSQIAVAVLTQSNSLFDNTKPIGQVQVLVSKLQVWLHPRDSQVVSARQDVPSLVSRRKPAGHEHTGTPYSLKALLYRRLIKNFTKIYFIRAQFCLTPCKHTHRHIQRSSKDQGYK